MVNTRRQSFGSSRHAEAPPRTPRRMTRSDPHSPRSTRPSPSPRRSRSPSPRRSSSLRASNDDDDDDDDSGDVESGWQPWKVHRRHKKRIQAFVAPTPEQITWTSWCLPCIAPHGTATYFLATFTGICAVTPLTNVTNFSLQYQLYLNAIFHREAVSFYTHACTMPTIDTFLLVLASFVKFSSEHYWLDLSLVIAVLINLWYLVWGITNNVPWMGFAAAPIVWLTWTLAHVFALNVYDVQPGDPNFVWYDPGDSLFTNPILLALFFSFVQAGSHFVEDLPPRVSGSPHWTTKREFFCGTVDDICELADRCFRAFFQLIFGTLDELVASPRLLPLFWAICPVYKMMRVFNLCEDWPSRKWLDESFEMYAKSLVKLPRMKRALIEGNLIVREVEDGDMPLSTCGQYIDTIATNLCCMKSVIKNQLNGLTHLRRIPDPALDYIGVGGGTFLRWEPRYKHPKVFREGACGVAGPLLENCITCDQTAYEPFPSQFNFDYWSARMNQCALHETGDMVGPDGVKTKRGRKKGGPSGRVLKL